MSLYTLLFILYWAADANQLKHGKYLQFLPALFVWTNRFFVTLFHIVLISTQYSTGIEKSGFFFLAQWWSLYRYHNKYLRLNSLYVRFLIHPLSNHFFLLPITDEFAKLFRKVLMVKNNYDDTFNVVYIFSIELRILKVFSFLNNFFCSADNWKLFFIPQISWWIYTATVLERLREMA